MKWYHNFHKMNHCQYVFQHNIERKLFPKLSKMARNSIFYTQTIFSRKVNYALGGYPQPTSETKKGCYWFWGRGDFPYSFILEEPINCADSKITLTGLEAVWVLVRGRFLLCPRHLRPRRQLCLHHHFSLSRGEFLMKNFNFSPIITFLSPEVPTLTYNDQGGPSVIF